MYSLILKTIILLGPFLKRAVFGDSSIKETLMKNKQITLLFIIILFLCYNLFTASKENVNKGPKVDVLRNRTNIQNELHERKSDLKDWLL